jgi:hypothetical protein
LLLARAKRPGWFFRPAAGAVLLAAISGFAGGGAAGAAAPFKPCFVNSGAVAEMGPCGGPVGTVITIQTLRQIANPIGKVFFYETSSQASIGGQICYSCATVSVSLAGQNNLAKGGTAAGSVYEFKAPVQLCLNGSNQGWAAFAIPTTGTPKYGYGDVGTFTIYSCPPPSAGGGAGGGGGGVHPGCSPGAANQVSINPATARRGSLVNLLYSCGTKLNFGNICCKPTGVDLYTFAGWRTLHYVNARMKPSASSPAPLHPSYRVVSPFDLAVTLPARLAPGTYAFVVHNPYTDGNWFTLTVT